MTFQEFTATLTDSEPPDGASGELRALWHDARGNWDMAHEIAQGIDTRSGAWIHAYLHRKEGDPANAGYWYRRAGQTPASDRLEEEWERIAKSVLGC